MHNDSATMSAVCLDDDCNVAVLDIDDDGVPDYVILRIRWVVASLLSALGLIVSAISL